MRFKVWKKINGEWKFHAEFKDVKKLVYESCRLVKEKHVEDLAIEEVKA